MLMNESPICRAAVSSVWLAEDIKNFDIFRQPATRRNKRPAILRVFYFFGLPFNNL